MKRISLFTLVSAAINQPSPTKYFNGHGISYIPKKVVENIPLNFEPHSLGGELTAWNLIPQDK